MTNAQTVAANPFALMMDPEAVFAAVASSDRLARLHSRICRPLDKPLVAQQEDGAPPFYGETLEDIADPIED
jgi:hypothetical protein